MLSSHLLCFSGAQTQPGGRGGSPEDGVGGLVEGEAGQAGSEIGESKGFRF